MDDYAGADGMRACFDDCMRLVDQGNMDDLMIALTVKASRTYEKHEVPRIAAAALLSLGEDGVRSLQNFLIEGRVGAIRGLAALRALWLAATGQPPMQSSLGIAYPEVTVSDATREQARLALDDYIAGAAKRPEDYAMLVDMQNLERPGGSGAALPPFSAHVLSVLRESSITLTISLIKEFEALVSAALPEADYQAFLEENPVFLDPLAAEVLNRQRLGLELVTDFVIRRHDSHYVVVEIEKPQDRIFTASTDFTAAFTHASGQVLDFQGWVAENVAYAQKRMPGIDRPKGLLIMGRRADMSPEAEIKLRRWLVNSKHIDVLTFDDLVRRARALHASLRFGV